MGVDLRLRATTVLLVACLALAAACGTSASDDTAAQAPDTTEASTTTTVLPTTTTTTAPPEPTTRAPSTTVPITTTARRAPLAGRVVVLDPGHNEGNADHPAEINQLVDVVTKKKECDTTGTETNAGYSEAAFTTDVVARTRRLLEAEGATVIVTRDASTPWGPCVTERAAIGNRAGADVALSVHADGAPASGRGFHVIRPGRVAGVNDAIVEPSARFATALHDAVAGGTPMPPASYIGSGGYDTRTDLGGLNLSTVPKVFIECGNMRNATDAALLSDPAFRQQLAEAIVAGIAAYLG